VGAEWLVRNVAFELRCVAICCVLTVGWVGRGVYRRTYRYKRNSHDAALPLLLPWSRAGRCPGRLGGSDGRRPGSGALAFDRDPDGRDPDGEERLDQQFRISLCTWSAHAPGARSAGTCSRAGSLRHVDEGTHGERTHGERAHGERGHGQGPRGKGAARGCAARSARRAGRGGDSWRPGGRPRRRSRGSFPRS